MKFLSFYSIVLFSVVPYIKCEGFIAYCPCMGRFGNQADHFLGALAFAKGTNRTLILPPWVEYHPGLKNSVQIPFNTYFKVNPLTEYNNVITMEDFMTTLAPDIWPVDKRVAFCYTDRGNGNGCNAKDGNPFGPFWDTFNVDFVGSEKYGPLTFDVHHKQMGEKWIKKYPAEKFPVIAFVGAPASFPVQQENRGLQKYLIWSDSIANQAKEFIKNKLPSGAFIGIHLRNGIDWIRACEHVPTSPNLFAAPQCLGYRNELGKATTEMCYPSKDTIVKQIKRLFRQMDNVKAIFVASDSNHMISELEDALKRLEISVHKLDTNSPHVDLAILGQAHHFIGNCISSFSAFVKRERDVRGFKSTFWGFPGEKKAKKHDEL